MRMSLKSESAPQLEDLEAMLASVQRQIQEEIDGDLEGIPLPNTLRSANPPNPSMYATINTTSRSRQPILTQNSYEGVNGNEDFGQQSENYAQQNYSSQSNNTPWNGVDSNDARNFMHRRQSESGSKGIPIGMTHKKPMKQGGTLPRSTMSRREGQDVSGSSGNLSKTSTASIPISGIFLQNVQKNNMDMASSTGNLAKASNNSSTMPRRSLGNIAQNRNSYKQITDQSDSTAQLRNSFGEVVGYIGKEPAADQARGSSDDIKSSADAVPEQWKEYWSR